MIARSRAPSIAASLAVLSLFLWTPSRVNGQCHPSSPDAAPEAATPRPIPDGNVRALAIFVQFAGDDFDSPESEWPLGGLPRWADKWSSEISEQLEGASAGRHHLVIDLYSKLVRTEHAAEWYMESEERAVELRREVLRSVDPWIDFSRYDHWTVDGSQFHHLVEAKADGNVDMLFMVYRRIPAPSESLHKLKFWGAGNAFLYVDPFKTDDGVTIHDASGVQQHEGADHVYEWSKIVAVHEYAHHLFGGHGEFPDWVGQPVAEDEERMRIE